MNAKMELRFYSLRDHPRDLTTTCKHSRAKHADRRERVSMWYR